MPSQSLSSPSMISLLDGFEVGSLSRQSPLQVANPSPSLSYISSGVPSQLLSTPSQGSVAPGKMVRLMSSQSPSSVE
jgi:hypothetical protein